jgi:transcriptional regulator with XRE-family HTH domain
MSSNVWTHGAYIRERRTALGLSQPALAREARVTAAMINRLESGQRRGRPPLLRALAAALQVPASELLDRAGYAAEAQYWQTQERTSQAPDSLVGFQYALGALSLTPAVQRALRALVPELAHDPEPGYSRRFDAAVAHYPGRTDADTARFNALRAVLFPVEDEPPA